MLVGALLASEDQLSFCSVAILNTYLVGLERERAGLKCWM